MVVCGSAESGCLGKLYVTGKARGRKAALDHVINSLAEKGENIKEQTIFLTHGDCLEDAEFVAKSVKEKYGVSHVIINALDPVIASHAGPGTIAIFFMGKER